ncbi:hypothetical protein LBWT_X3840 (plasmid) [Leptolyngbya boryana IAM M-101]|nr:hypothetical protein LBWT_X3840 [Leptolyngbya boryana IAM M-101]BAS66660.1 hypothetical protein LBDG_X3840 [Leptolyngbya boryana dg5]
MWSLTVLTELTAHLESRNISQPIPTDISILLPELTVQLAS